MKATYNKERLGQDLVHLARLALGGRTQDVRLLLRRLARRYQDSIPELADQMISLLRDAPTRSSPLRGESPASIPVDHDSRIQLLRHELARELEVQPVFEKRVKDQLVQLVAERRGADRLLAAGLTPTRSVLFTGPPGVGKSLAAHWLAHELGLPLLTLDLSAVMSSFLGRTGNNLRFVLDYAKGQECVLFLDELDAIAKRRDDATEVGELKRLVTVLLQEIDDWPPEGLLVAATNHSGLLDPAVWRRFEMRVEFPMPDAQALARAVQVFMGPEAENLDGWRDLLPEALAGLSFNDVETELTHVRRALALGPSSLDQLMKELVTRHLVRMPRDRRAALAARLVRTDKLSQRQAHEMTDVSRDTIRKAMRKGGGVGSNAGKA
jgi:SpoVK/Ycf46/Vps4 family AAA+-type ATPase